MLTSDADHNSFLYRILVEGVIVTIKMNVKTDFSGLSKKPVNIKCPVCNAPIKFTLGQIGKSVVCPKCGKTIQLTGK